MTTYEIAKHAIYNNILTYKINKTGKGFERLYSEGVLSTEEYMEILQRLTNDFQLECSVETERLMNK